MNVHLQNEFAQRYASKASKTELSKHESGAHPVCIRCFGTSAMGCIAVVPLVLKLSATKNSGVTSSGLHLNTSILLENYRSIAHTQIHVGFHEDSSQ